MKIAISAPKNNDTTRGVYCGEVGLEVATGNEKYVNNAKEVHHGKEHLECDITRRHVNPSAHALKGTPSTIEGPGVVSEERLSQQENKTPLKIETASILLTQAANNNVVLCSGQKIAIWRCCTGKMLGLGMPVVLFS